MLIISELVVIICDRR